MTVKQLYSAACRLIYEVPFDAKSPGGAFGGGLGRATPPERDGAWAGTRLPRLGMQKREAVHK